MKWINSTKLQQWADEKETEGLFPELIRKLILASDCDLKSIDIPVGDSISKPGWDGVISSGKSHLYVPKGDSFWEFGKDKKVKSKADKDYSKRTQGTPEKERKKGILVFVSPRRWNGKKAWIKSKVDEKKWKQVKAYDADDLEVWIEQNPAVGSWLAMKLKISTRGVESAEEFWNKWISNGEIVFTPELIIAGREKEKSEIISFLDGDPGNLKIQTSSIMEAILFSIASKLLQGSKESEFFLNRSVIVSDYEALKEISTTSDGLKIFYVGDESNPIFILPAGNHHIVKPIDFSVKSSGVSLSLPKHVPFAEELRNIINEDFERASKLTKQCGKSLSVLKRILSESQGRTSWNENYDISELIPLFLVGAFDEDSVGDKKILELLSGEKYEDYRAKIKKWTLILDTPLYQVSNFWGVVSQYDTLFAISKVITKDHLKTFEKVIKTVLTEINPALELDPKSRAFASLYQKERRYSSRIRESLCQTLVLLAVQGDIAEIDAGFNIQYWADKTVEDILDKTVEDILDKSDLNFWLSVESVLHLLTEASPISFLNSLEELISRKPEVIRSMFDDSDYHMFQPTYHTGLLHSLESIAWNPRFLSRVTNIFLDLIALDIGYKTANRPSNSLFAIYLPWKPHTYATIEQRHEILKKVTETKPDIAFDLLIDLAPNNHTYSFPTSKPIWRMREREYNEHPVENKELYNDISNVARLILETAKNNENKWIKVIPFLDDFTGNDRKILIDSLCSITKFIGDVSSLREKLRSFIHNIKIYDKESLTKEEIVRLDDFYGILINSPVEKYAWLFDVDFLALENHKELSYADEQLLIKEEREKALSEIYRIEGFKGVLSLVEMVGRPNIVGMIFSQLNSSTNEDVIKLLPSKSQKHTQFCQGFIFKESESNPNAWVESSLKLISSFTTEIQVLVFLSITPSRELWEQLKQHSKQVYDGYWDKIKVSLLDRLSDPEMIMALGELNKRKRFLTSLDLISPKRKTMPVNLIVEILEELATNPLEEKDNAFMSIGWTIAELFKRLDNEDVELSKMQQLEWDYIELFGSSHTDRKLKYLNKALTQKPDFFAEVVSWIYVPDEGVSEAEKAEINEELVSNRAKKASDLLDSWDDLPGLRDDKTIDFKYLSDWVKKGMEACVNLKRKKIGAYQIGKMLGHSREDNLPIWPPEEICEILKELDNEEVLKGFYSGAYSGRRVKAGISQAGNQGPIYRDKSKWYEEKADDLIVKYQSVAEVLYDISTIHKSWAELMDKHDAQDDL